MDRATGRPPQPIPKSSADPLRSGEGRAEAPERSPELTGEGRLRLVNPPVDRFLRRPGVVLRPALLDAVVGDRGPPQLEGPVGPRPRDEVRLSRHVADQLVRHVDLL